jgi:lambda family phage holin
MPAKDPNNWQVFLALLATAWPQIYAAALAFVVALVRGVHAGGKPMKSILEAILCGCLTLALVPVLDYFGINQNLAVAIGASIAFLGTEWFRDRVDAIARRFIDRWTK